MIVSYFWDSYFLSYGEFVDIKMKLRGQALQPALASGAHEPYHWSEGRHNNVGMYLRERLATTQVMLGVSLRARWDATLVVIIIAVNKVYQR